MTVGEFLERNPDFVFHLLEHIEATKHAAPARERFGAFCRAGPPPSDPWEQARPFVAGTAGTTPAYAGIDWTQPAYADSLPLISKQDLIERPDAFLNPSYPVAEAWLRPTSGTTGPPVDVYFSPEFAVEFQYFTAQRIAWLAGALTDEVRRRDTFCLALFDNKYLPDRVWPALDGDTGLTLRPIYDETDPAAPGRLVGLLEEHRPAILSAKPNLLEAIFDLDGTQDAATRYDLRLVTCGGADLPRDLRDEAQRRLGTPIVDAYGLSEFGIFASECRLRQGLHVYADTVIAEVLDDAGRVTREGAGEVVLSGLVNAAMPLLRYRTGDFAEITTAPCGCGRRGPRLLDIDGRRFLNFKLADGSQVSPTNFAALFKEFPIREFRLTQTAVDRVAAEVEFLDPQPELPPSLDAVREWIAGRFGHRVTVDVTSVVFPAEAKFQRFQALR